MTQVIIHDESISGKSIGEITFDIPSERITVRELIRSRIYQETKESNARAASRDVPPPVVELNDVEVALNGQQKYKPKIADWNAQFEKALDAFRTKQILVLIDDRQVNTLDEEVMIQSGTSIRFLRLTMLMGG